MDQNLWRSQLGHFTIWAALSPAVTKFTLHENWHLHCGDISLCFLFNSFSFCAKSLHAGSCTFSRLFRFLELSIYSLCRHERQGNMHDNSCKSIKLRYYDTDRSCVNAMLACVCMILVRVEYAKSSQSSNIFIFILLKLHFLMTLIGYYFHTLHILLLCLIFISPPWTVKFVWKVILFSQNDSVMPSFDTC